LHVGTLHLRDQFEWPLYGSNKISPEDFARQYCSELGIGGEFVPAVAHNIREQICFGRLEYDATVAAPNFSRLTRPPFRNDGDEENWEPELRELDEYEIERLLKEKERNAR